MPERDRAERRRQKRLRRAQKREIPPMQSVRTPMGLERMGLFLGFSRYRYLF